MYSFICLLFKDGNNGEVKLVTAYSSRSILCQFVVFSVGVADRTWNLERVMTVKTTVVETDASA